MRSSRMIVAWMLLMVSLAGCAERAPAPGPGGDDDDGGAVDPPATSSTEVPAMLAGDYGATIETSLGTFEVELWEDKAPLHVANFLQYAEDGHYANTVFHRVVKGFVIQGGGFAAPFTGESGPKPTHGPLPLEADAAHLHEPWTLGAARTNDPDSATSQWFVNTARNTNLDAQYTVFGIVTSGTDVVTAIENAEVGAKGQFQGVPVEDVVIQSVTVRTPEAPGAVALVPYGAEYGVAPGGTISIPLLVKNVGGSRVEPAPDVADAPEGVSVEWKHVPGALSAGWSGVAIAEIRAAEDFDGGDITFTSGDGTATVLLRKIDASGPVAGEEHPKVSVYYLGLYDYGGVFDTTSTGLADRGFPVVSRFREHPEPLKVWVGEGEASGGYTPVIPGFSEGVKGLRAGETATVRLSPEEGYRDGNWRIFEIRVASLDA